MIYFQELIIFFPSLNIFYGGFLLKYQCPMWSLNIQWFIESDFFRIFIETIWVEKESLMSSIKEKKIQLKKKKETSFGRVIYKNEKNKIKKNFYELMQVSWIFTLKKGWEKKNSVRTDTGNYTIYELPKGHCVILAYGSKRESFLMAFDESSDITHPKYYMLLLNIQINIIISRNKFIYLLFSC